MGHPPAGSANGAPKTGLSGDTTLRGGPRGIVLLVDDSQIVRDIIGTTLRTAGYTVQEAEDGSAAVALLERCRYDVVVSDLKMPGMDGFDVLEAVRRQQPDAELIVLTGTHSQDINAAVRALRLGAHDFLLKPLSGADQAVLSVDRAVEKKRQREALREAEARYRQLFDRVPVALYRTTREGRFLEANPSLVQMLGCRDRESLLATNAATFFAQPAERQRWRQTVEKDGVLKSHEVSLRRVDGTLVWAEENVRAVRDADGTIVCYEGSLQDVTERHRALEALRLKTAQLEGVAAAMTSFLTSDDLGPACASLLATAVAQSDSRYGFIGVVDGSVLNIAAEKDVPWAQVVGEETRQAAVQTDASGRLAFSGDVLASVLEVSGTVLEAPGAAFLAVPILRGHEVVGVIAVGGCPSGYPAAERGHLELLTHATGVIFGSHRQARTQALLEAQLRQAQKMEAVGRLAGGVAHDFNNLLTVINGYGEIMQRDLPLGHPRRRQVDEIMKAGERAAALVRQLLAFSRRQVVHPRILDLNAVVADLDSLLRRLIGEDIELVADPAPDLDSVTADPGQLEQVLMNLVVNSRDALPEGGRITLETRNVDLDDEYLRTHVGAVSGPHVMLAVTDDGQGMDRETQAHIFEPFFTTKEQGKGTGLGLATVYGIVQQAGGSIVVESEVGNGTTVRIYLPRTDAPAEPLPQSVPAREPLHGTETILLVEDEEMLRELVAEALAQYGYDVLLANGGAQALRLVGEREGTVSLLVTDVVMPGMSGPQLAEQLKAERPDMKVLFMSGYSDRDACRSAIAGGIFLQKPFRVEDLAARVRTLLDG